MDDKTSGKRGFFIVKLNFVDGVTLSGVFLAGTSIALMVNRQFEFALAVLYLAVISDAFDGILARKYGLTRDFGRYLDGFVDTIDYLVAPCLFLYLWGFNAPWQGLLLLLLICSGFVRLSVFNEIGNIKDEDDGLSYLGAPVFWTTLVLGPVYLAATLLGENVVFTLLSLAIPLFSVLMVHNGRYHKFKNPKRILFVLMALAILFFTWGMMGQGPGMFADEVVFLPHVVTGLLAAVPVIVGGVLHMVVVRFDLLPFLKIPIHREWFGANKTVRGFVVMPLASMLGFGLLSAFVDSGSGVLTVDFEKYSVVISGSLIGLAYVIAELPNSYIKRRLGVPPGEVPTSNARLFIMMDQLDSGMLCLVCFWIFWDMPLLTCLVTLIMAPLIALSVKRILFSLNLKKSST